MKVALFIETPSALAQLIQENFLEFERLYRGQILEKLVIAIPDETELIARRAFSNIPYLEVRRYQILKIANSHARAANAYFQIKGFEELSTSSKWSWPVDNATDFLDCAVWVRFSKDIFRKGSLAFFPIVPTYILGGCLFSKNVFEKTTPKEFQRIRSIIQSSAGLLVCGCQDKLFAQAMISERGQALDFQCYCKESKDTLPQKQTDLLPAFTSCSPAKEKHNGLFRAIRALVERVSNVQE